MKRIVNPGTKIWIRSKQCDGALIREYMDYQYCTVLAVENYCIVTLRYDYGSLSYGQTRTINLCALVPGQEYTLDSVGGNIIANERWVWGIVTE